MRINDGRLLEEHERTHMLTHATLFEGVAHDDPCLLGPVYASRLAGYL